MAVSIAGTYMVSSRIINEKSSSIINSLEEESRQNERQVYIPIADICTGETVSADMIEATTAYSSIESSLLFTGEDIGKTALCNIPSGTFLQSCMVSEGFSDGCIREVECTDIKLPANIVSGDVADVRIYLPDGSDFVVISKKHITLPVTDRNAEGMTSEIPGISGDCRTCYMELSDNEIETLSCAVAESALYDKAYLYTVKYVDPLTQEASKVTYLPDEARKRGDAQGEPYGRPDEDQSNGKYAAERTYSVTPEEEMQEEIWTP